MIERFEHDTFPIKVQVVDSRGKPVSLSGATLEFAVVGDSTVTFPCTIVDASRGEAQVDMKAHTLSPGAYKCALRMTDSAGFVYTLFVDDLRIKEDYL